MIKRNNFIISSLVSLPQHVLYIFAHRFRVKLLATQINQRVHKKLLKKTKLKHFNVEQINEYGMYYDRAIAWHGTGRYQYNKTQIVDSFQKILADKALLPSTDVYSIFIDGKSMQSISATRLRIIARSYADTHGRGASEHGRYGSSLFWASYYYAWFYVRFFTVDIVRAIKNWRKWKAQASNHKKEILWGKKVNNNAKGVWDTFTIGSDILGNYPILFAIKKGLKRHNLPKPYNKFEIRYAEPVPLSYINHIEVPLHRVDETKAIMDANNIAIKVFPIELGEYYASKQNFSKLLGYEND